MRSQRRLLLLGNSQNAGQRYLEHAKGIIKDFLGTRVDRVLFIPFARVLPSLDDFASKVRIGFHEMGYRLDSVHEVSDQRDAVTKAQAIVVGGGNTFYLLHQLYETGLLESIRKQVANGVPYIGWSAGSNIACPTIRTTNDMPIVEPRSFKALDLIPFQINPHYVDQPPTKEYVETKEDRIIEFIEVNPDVYVVGLREGSILQIEGASIKLSGSSARVFLKGKEATNYKAEESVQFVLD